MDRFAYRGTFATLLLVLSLLLVGANLLSEPGHSPSELREQSQLSLEQRDALAPPRNGTTVLTSHQGVGTIVALGSQGRLRYYDEAHDGYWDVDPSPEGRQTVIYSATDKLYDAKRCEPVDGGNYCIRQTIERANLTTGEVTRLYSQVQPRYHSSEWHDVDRVGESRFAVADMYADEVFIVNTTAGIVTWEWSAQEYLPLDSGGQFPDDWVHLNDVEILDDGRLMVSLRNHDQVVFLDPETGVEEGWTLGGDERHDVLHNQHNPDYIPPERGGPAVLVADSENNRVIEYQRTTSGDWERTWTWSDERLQWGRDADRLPNGNTLVTDTHGGRVLEVDEQGDVVWSVNVPSAYEAERLGTGDESAGGRSAAALGLDSRTSSSADAEKSGSSVSVVSVLKSIVPSKVLNGLAYVMPLWMSVTDLLLILAILTVGLLWGAFEVRRGPLQLRSPVVWRD